MRGRLSYMAVKRLTKKQIKLAIQNLDELITEPERLYLNQGHMAPSLQAKMCLINHLEEKLK